MCSKDADRLTYSKDPNQTDQSNPGLLCLIRSINTKTLDDYAQYTTSLYTSSDITGRCVESTNIRL